MSVGSGGNDVEVKFGGSTSDLDAAANKAGKSIEHVGKETEALHGVFEKAKEGLLDFTKELKLGWADGWVQGLKEVKGSADIIAEGGLSAMTGMGAIGLGIAGVAAATVAALPALVEWESKFGEMAEQLDNTSQRLGISVSELTQWNAVANAMKVPTEAMTGSFTKLEKAMVLAANGGKAQSAAFKALGVDVNSVKSPSEAILTIADKFKTMDDGPKKVALAMATMGRGGTALIPILNKGSEAIKEMFGDADKYSASWSESMVQAGLAVDESGDKMELAFTGLQNLLYEAFAPVVVTVTDMIGDLVKSMIESYKAGGAMAMIVGVISGAFKVVLTVISTVATGFTELWHIGVAALEGILGTIYSVGAALAKLLSGDFSAVKAAWVGGMKGTGSAISAEFDKAGAAGQRYRDRMQKLWGVKGLGGEGAKVAPEAMDLNVPGMGPKAKKAPKEKKDNTAENALKDQIEELNYKQELAKDDYEETMRLEEQKLAKLKAFYGEDSRQYVAELRNKAKMEREHSLEIVKIEQQRITAQSQLAQTKASTDANVANTELEAAKAHFNAQDQMGLVHDNQRIAAQRQFAAQSQALEAQSENTIYAIKAQALRDELALMNLPVAEKRKINIELEQLELEHQGKMREIQAKSAASTQAINDTAAQQSMQKWQSIVDPVANSFDQMLNSMEAGNTSFKQALLTMGDQILQSFISMGVKMLAHWVTMELAKTSTTAVGTTTRVGIEATGAATSNAITAASTLKHIAMYAVRAAAGAYSAIASIPIVGPILAPIAAAAALYGVYRLGSSIFSAEGGDAEVPYDGAQYQLHKKEMVLPAKFANPLRNMLTGGGPQTSGLGGAASSAGAEARAMNQSSSATFNYQPTHNNQDTSLDALLRSEGSAMRKWFRNEVRNNKFGMLGEPA